MRHCSEWVSDRFSMARVVGNDIHWCMAVLIWSSDEGPGSYVCRDYPL